MIFASDEDTEAHAGELALEAGDDLGQSLRLEESTTAWVAVIAWVVVMRASWMSYSSWMALTMGASLLVAQDAHETRIEDNHAALVQPPHLPTHVPARPRWPHSRRCPRHPPPAARRLGGMYALVAEAASSLP